MFSPPLKRAGRPHRNRHNTSGGLVVHVAEKPLQVENRRLRVLVDCFKTPSPVLFRENGVKDMRLFGIESKGLLEVISKRPACLQLQIEELPKKWGGFPLTLKTVCLNLFFQGSLYSFSCTDLFCCSIIIIASTTCRNPEKTTTLGFNAKASAVPDVSINVTAATPPPPKQKTTTPTNKRFNFRSQEGPAQFFRGSAQGWAKLA